MLNLTPFILLLPLLGFVALGLVGRWLPRAVISLVACGLVFGSFAAAALDLVAMIAAPVATRSADTTLFTWIVSGNLSITFGTLSDPLSAVMLLIVTGVSFLIHVYSIGYMADDPGYWRFFSFLNLFVFAMTLLVAADSFLFLLVGWALVGLASFLLIGFWYTRPSAVAAAQKAFVVNVIGDFGLLLAIFLLYSHFHTLAYGVILHSSSWVTNPLCITGVVCGTTPAAIAVSATTTTAIALLLFLAAAAKSAQLPLHVWLPDAMEGPTPVSALIHAATMVTAGVYLVARAAPIFASSSDARGVVAAIAGATALFAATIACRQFDVKRVLAYSTMSQLAYMFMGEAAGGYSLGIFHLMTHAFFKALLFMCAGAVIHALAGEQDMRKMGGLARRMPPVFWMFVIGGAALAAVFPLAGFWSKDDILGVVLQQGITTGSAGWYVLYATGLVTAIFTGFYMFRLIFLVFSGDYRGEAIPAGHASLETTGTHAGRSAGGRAGDSRDPLAGLHAVGAVMLVPMGILALLSIVGGFINTPFDDALTTFLSPSLPGFSTLAIGSGVFWLASGLGIVSGPLGILIAQRRYGGRSAASRGRVPSFAPTRNPLLVLWERKYYVDELYERAIVRPILWVGALLRRDLEERTLDGGSRGVGTLVGWASRGFRSLQTGYARNYALAIFFGAALLVVYYVFRR
jgi:NADH-quinone oxidoreductase subunit L